MLSLVDRWHARTFNRYFQRTFTDRSRYYEIQVLPPLISSPGRELWICFPGFLHMEIRLYHAWGIHNILPKKGKVVVVNGPDAIAGFTPHDSVEAMKKLDVIVQDLVGHHNDYRLGIFGISAGTYPAFHFANKYRASRLIAIAPGPRMGQGIYTSIFSRVLKKKCILNGFPDWKSYDAVIAPYNQENNIADLPSGDDLMIFGGRFDRVIRYSGTREIVALCRDAGKHPTFRTYSLFGHTMLGAWVAGMNKLGFDPYGMKRRGEPQDEVKGIPF